jgi:hypothetical protein
MKRLVLVLTLAICISSVSAGVYDERSAVSRIVGDSPEELLAQLNSEPLVIEDSGFVYSLEDDMAYVPVFQPVPAAQQVLNVLKKETTAYETQDYSSDVLLAALQSNRDIHVVVSSLLDLTRYEGGFRTRTLDSSDFEPFESSIDSNGAFIVSGASSDVGVYYPKSESYVPSLLGEVLIAPSSFGIPEFERAFGIFAFALIAAGSAIYVARELPVGVRA